MRILGLDEALAIDRPVVFNLFLPCSIPVGCNIFLLLEMVHHTLIMGGTGDGKQWKEGAQEHMIDKNLRQGMI